MRTKMVSLGLPTTTVNNIIDDPTVLHPLLSPNATTSPPSPINPSTAIAVLSAYTHGVHTVFTLNAALAAVCVIVAAAMIRHKELIRADEAEMRRRALLDEKPPAGRDVKKNAEHGKKRENGTGKGLSES